MTKTFTHPIGDLFMNAMRLFDYNNRDRTKRWAENAIMREKRLVGRIMKHFNPEPEQAGGSGLLGEDAEPATPQRKRLRRTGRSQGTPADLIVLTEDEGVEESQAKKIPK